MGNIKTGNGILGTLRRDQASVLVGEDEDGGCSCEERKSKAKGQRQWSLLIPP